MGGLISYFFGESAPTEVTDLPQTEDSSSEASSSPVPEQEPSDLPHEYTPEDTSRTESIFHTTSRYDYVKNVDKINICVIHAGKMVEIMIFPLERIACLLQQACDQVQKNPKDMKLIFEGEELDLMKTVSQYSRLRGGKKVNLIRSC